MAEEPVEEEPIAAEDEVDSGGGLFSGFGEEEDTAPVDSDNEMLHSRRENSVLFSLDDLTRKGEEIDVTTAQGDDSGLIDIRQVAVDDSGQDDLFSGFGAGDASAADVSADVPMAGGSQATLAMPILRKKSRWPLYLAASFVGAVVLAGAVYAAMTMMTGPGEKGIRQAVASASEMAFTQINQTRLKLETEHQGAVAAARATGKEKELAAEREAEAEMASFSKELEQRLADVETLNQKKLGDLEIKLEDARKAAEERKKRRLAAEAALKKAEEAAATAAATTEVAVAEKKAPKEARVETKEERQARHKRREERKAQSKKEAKKEVAKKEEKKVEKKAEKKESAGSDDKKKDANAFFNAMDKKGGDGGSDGTAAKKPSKKTLTTTDIMRVVNKNKGAMRKCFQKYGAGLDSATIRTKLKISGSGEVTNVSISSMEFAGTALGNCVRKSQAKMKFPAFAKTALTKSISVRLP